MRDAHRGVQDGPLAQDTSQIEFLKLEATGDNIATNVPLGGLVLEGGMLGCQHETMRLILAKLAAAINKLSEQVRSLESDTEEVKDNVNLVERNQLADEGRMQEFEAFLQELRVQQLNVQCAPIPDDVADAVADAPERTSEGEAATHHGALEKSVTQLSQRVEEVASQSKEWAGVWEALEAERAEKFRAQREALDDLVQTSVQQNELQMDLKRDLELLHIMVKEQGREKASVKETERTRLLVVSLAERQTQHETTLRDSSEKFGKLDELFAVVSDNTARTQDMWRTSKSELLEFRSWVSRLFDGFRQALKSKMDDQQVNDHIGRLRSEVRELGPQLSDAAYRAGEGVRNKADMADLVKLADVVEEIAKDSGRTEQLLIGTRCLSCDRPTTRESRDHGRISLDRMRQQDELFRSVEEAIRDSGGKHHELNYVAVHVGSKEHGTIPGSVLATHGQDDSLGSFAVAPMKKRLLMKGRNRSRCEGSPTVPRSPPREVPPLVRVPLRRLTGGMRPPRTAPARVDASSLRAALGEEVARATNSHIDDSRTSSKMELDHELVVAWDEQQ
mmetsp:Transcript_40810/g.108146  ORF Transcript_40810/g.108146 Transcript_40810/m.108146 type:complete len:562 (-) Transcript_40810:197-1882(-)